MPKRSSIRPTRDVEKLSRLIEDMANGQTRFDTTVDGKNPAAVALGRMGGLKGGPARAEKLSARKRSEIARLAAVSRWKKHDR